MNREEQDVIDGYRQLDVYGKAIVKGVLTVESARRQHAVESQLEFPAPS